jgi:hypothetical protein
MIVYNRTAEDSMWKESSPLEEAKEDIERGTIHNHH